MTTIALDQPGRDTAPQAPKSGRSVRRTGKRRSSPIDKGRILAVVGVGAAVIGGFSGAMTLLGGLAAPPPRPVMAMNTRAAEWPDLRDGVPALSRPAPAPQGQSASSSGDIAPSASPLAPPASLRTALDPLRTALDPVAPPAAKAASASRTPAGTLPQIENAVLVAPAREAALVVQPRSAALLRPQAYETVRARTAAASSFASLEPDESTASVAVPAKEPAAREPVKPRLKVATVKPARVAAPAVATTAASAPVEADADETEVLGVKIPSLASAGRKLRDAFGGGATAAAE